MPRSTLVLTEIDPVAGRFALSATTFGLLLVAAAALIMAMTIALSRFAIKTTLAPPDLLALRFGIGGLLFLPILVRTWRTLPSFGRGAALPLSFLHGWGMAGSSMLGLMFAPASHAAALGPGCVPFFLAIIAYATFRRRLARQQVIGLTAIVVGAIGLLGVTGAHPGDRALVGDALFLAAAFCAACYFVLVERYQVPALAGNAVVIVFSGIIVVPAYLIFFESNIPSAPWRDVALQALFQGMLMSAAYVAVHQAVLLIGGARVTMIMAILPVLTLLAGRSIAGDPVTFPETLAILAISGGIVYGALWRLRGERPMAVGRTMST